MKKIFFVILSLFLWSAANVQAQVTIGSNTPPDNYSLLDLDATNVKGGLHLPRLTAAQRNTLITTSADTLAAVGLLIYSTDTDCQEYWNGSRWISLCTGTAYITISPELQSPVPSAGLIDEGPFTPKDDPEPSCNAPEPYTVMVISGNHYLHVAVTDPGTGAFMFSFDANTTALTRYGIIRITNNCTSEYKEFVIAQEGDATVCGQFATAPQIASASGEGTICGGGQAILYVSNFASLSCNESDIVWEFKGEEVGRGRTLFTTQAGNYTAYLSGIGCQQKSNTVNLTISQTSAPLPVLNVDAENGGMICAGASITLTAYQRNDADANDQVWWYQNDVLAPAPNPGPTYTTDVVGTQWYAVAINSVTQCVSQKSNIVTTKEGTGAKPNLTSGGVLINGQTMLSKPTLCNGMTAKLEIATPEQGVNYDWYANAEPIGSGNIIMYTLPLDAKQIVFQVIASGIGCTTAATLDADISVAQPAKPIINPSPSFVCAASTLTLTTNQEGSMTYQWFKDGEKIPGGTGTSYTTNVGGNFAVQGSQGTCLTEMSDTRRIDLAGAPTGVMFTIAPSQSIPDTEIPFQVTAANVSEWEWSIDGIKTHTGNTAIYQWSSTGQRTVVATAKNNCGVTSVSTNINIEYNQMATPAIVLVSGGGCGSGARYKIDVDNYADKAILTSVQWLVKLNSTPIPFNTIGSKQEIVTFEYGLGGSFTIEAVAVGVGKTNSVAATASLMSSSPTTKKVRLYGPHIYDVAKTGSNLSQREANIFSGTSQTYHWYDATRISTTNGSYTWNFNRDVPGIVSYQWSVDDPHGLLTNANAINGCLTKTVTLVFGDAVNSITNGASKSLTLSCILTDAGGCAYPQSQEITVQDKFACGTGGVTTLLKGANASYKTYTFPINGNQCWMVHDSREGSNPSYPSATRSDRNPNGYHYSGSSSSQKNSACLPGWHVPTCGSANTEWGRLGDFIQNTTLNSEEYKQMFYIDYSAQHGYSGTNTWYAWEIWNCAGVGADDHEFWMERTTSSGGSTPSTKIDYDGNADRESYSVRCVKDSY